MPLKSVTQLTFLILDIHVSTEYGVLLRIILIDKNYAQVVPVLTQSAAMREDIQREMGRNILSNPQETADKLDSSRYLGLAYFRAESMRYLH
jgi:hypothetical protein